VHDDRPVTPVVVLALVVVDTTEKAEASDGDAAIRSIRARLILVDGERESILPPPSDAEEEGDNLRESVRDLMLNCDS
jgi:hypothetical protein